MNVNLNPIMYRKQQQKAYQIAVIKLSKNVKPISVPLFFLSLKYLSNILPKDENDKQIINEIKKRKKIFVLDDMYIHYKINGVLYRNYQEYWEIKVFLYGMTAVLMTIFFEYLIRKYRDIIRQCEELDLLFDNLAFEEALMDYLENLDLFKDKRNIPIVYVIARLILKEKCEKNSKLLFYLIMLLDICPEKAIGRYKAISTLFSFLMYFILVISRVVLLCVFLSFPINFIYKIFLRLLSVLHIPLKVILRYFRMQDDDILLLNFILFDIFGFSFLYFLEVKYPRLFKRYFR